MIPLSKELSLHAACHALSCLAGCPGPCHTLGMILKCIVIGSTSETGLRISSILVPWLVRLKSESNVSMQISPAVTIWLAGVACLGCSKDWQAAQGHLAGG